MTDRIRRFPPRTAATTARASSSTSTSCATTTRLRQGAAGHARVLCREGQSGPRSARPPRPARLLLRHGLGGRDRAGAGHRRHRRTASPSATPSRRSATSRAPMRSASACSRSIARPRSRRSPARRPGSKVFCRILCDGEGAEWPLSRKFGCVPEMAARVLEHAHRLGLVAYGLSFHVGSQQRNPRMWDGALAVLARRSSRISPSAASTCRWSTSAAASRPST